MSVTIDETGRVAGVQPEEATRLRSLAEGLRLSMIHLSRRLHRSDPSELTITLVSGLASVISAGPLGVGRLAELEGLPSSAATCLADKLEAAGLVVRQATPGDRRGVQVLATQAGRELMARRAQAGNERLAERLAALSDADRRCIERGVEILKALAADRPGQALAAGADANATEELNT